jgi:hypothetical protein
MSKIAKRIKAKLRNWLGINDIACELSSVQQVVYDMKKWVVDGNAITAVAIDTHFHGDSESLIIVCSKLNGGTIRFIPAEFEHISGMMHFIEMMEKSYKPERFYFDGPLSLTREIDREMRRKTGRQYVW